MEKRTNGLRIAKDILIIITFLISLANFIIMIVKMASDAKHNRRYVTFKDSDELPF